MPWTTLTPHWPDLLTRLAARFRHLDPRALARFRGDRATLVQYLAETHDLTMAEAAETLDDWLRRETRQPLQQTAA